MVVIYSPDLSSDRNRIFDYSCLSIGSTGIKKIILNGFKISEFEKEEEGIIYLDCGLILTQLSASEWELSGYRKME